MSKLLVLCGVIVGLCLLYGSLWAQQEAITITTYYPSPNGSYRELEWGDLPSRSRGLLTADQGSSIELGGLAAGGGAGTPYIDFHNDMTAGNNYDYRIYLANDNILYLQGAAYNTTTSSGKVRIGTAAGNPQRIEVREIWYCASFY